MRKSLLFLLLLFSLQIRAQQDNAPVAGVSDKRVEVYGLKNARVVVDYQTTLENTDILITMAELLLSDRSYLETLSTTLQVRQFIRALPMQKLWNQASSGAADANPLQQ
jgi:hypothetical protein